MRTAEAFRILRGLPPPRGDKAVFPRKTEFFSRQISPRIPLEESFSRTTGSLLGKGCFLYLGFFPQLHYFSSQRAVSVGKSPFRLDLFFFTRLFFLTLPFQAERH